MGLLIKDTGILTEDATQVVKVWNNTGVLVTNTSSSFVAKASRQMKSGVSIPNFHARVKRGELLPHTPFNQVEWHGEHLGGDHWANLKANPLNHSSVDNFPGPSFGVPYRIGDFAGNDCDPTVPPAESVPEYLLQQAAGRIYAKGFDALTAGAELNKTRSMFKGVTSRIVNLARNFSTKRMAKLWLEGRYGWRTLAYDIRDLHSAVTEFDNERTLWSERAGYNLTSSSTALVGSASDVDFTYQLTKSLSHKWSLRGSVSGLIKPSQFVFDPLKTGWELTPYSFIIDWVYNVGVAIDTIGFLRMASDWSASTGFECKSEVRFDVSATPKSTRNGQASAAWSYSGTLQSRSPVTLIPTLPQLTNRSFTSAMKADLLALAHVRSRFR